MAFPSQFGSSPPGTAGPQASRTPLWTVLLAAGAIAGIGMGLRQLMGLYLKPVTEHLAVGREAFSLSIALANLVWGMAAPIMGAIADIWGTARIVCFGGVCTALGMIVLVLATSELHMLVSGVLLGLGVAGTGQSAVIGAVGRAAGPQLRTWAISMVGIGAGIGVLVALPYADLLIRWIGWQQSLYVLAASALLVCPVAFFLGDGERVEHTGRDRHQAAGEALREALAHPSFLLLTSGFFVCGFQVAFYAFHLPAYLADRGIDTSVAVLALTVVGLGNLLGTWIAGHSAKYVPKRFGLVFIYLGRAVVFLGFIYLPIDGPTVVVLSALLGVLWLSTIPLTSGLVATFFGTTWMTMLYGVVFLSHQIGSFAGIWLAGYLYDQTRSYDTMWWISIGLGVAAAIVHWPIREEPVARLRAVVRPAGA